MDGFEELGGQTGPHLARSRRVVADEALEESDREGDEGDAGDEDERGDRVDERPDDDEDEEGRGDGADEFADVGLPVFDDAFDGVGEQRDQAPGLLGADSRGPKACSSRARRMRRASRLREASVSRPRASLARQTTRIHTAVRMIEDS